MASKRAAYQRRGRAALLGTGVVFAVVQLTAGLLLDWRGLAVRFPSAAQALASARRGGRSPDVILLGSSRFGGLPAPLATALLRREHPEAGPIEVCNAAVPAGDPIAEDYVMEHLLAQGSRPRLAVIEVSPDMLGRYNPCFNMHCHRQIVWWDTPWYLVDVCRAGELRKLATARLVPLYAHRRELMRQASLAVASLVSPPTAPQSADAALPADQPIPWDSLLEVPLPPLAPDDVAAARQDAARRIQKQFRGYQARGTTAAALEHLIRRCRDNGVEVILVGASVTSFFRQDFTPDVDASYTACIGRLTRTYGCRFIDFRDAAPDQAFEDLFHLHPVGGRAVICKLTREVLSPWLEEQEDAAHR